ncbi:MAG: VOC family protein [Synechococcales cyanobacterium SupBloom_Metag_052]|jgi:catechol 2,3-dioxygenase-like lactoylglutathione lyase family enzyme|nr:VOC family protein [Synechococcales cyanobacterium SupBloom_Metag_052]
MAVGQQAVDGIKPAGSQQEISPLGRQSWLGHVALRVQDMERAKRFYGAMGLELTWDASDWAYLQRPDGGDGIALLSPEYKAAGPHFAFHYASREQVQAEHTRLQAAGMPVGELHDHRDGTASFYLQDPEGNWLELLYEPAAGIGSNRS